MILTRAGTLNEVKIDLDPSDIEAVYENDTASGGTVVVTKNGNRYLVKEDFATVEAKRNDTAT